MRTFAQTGALPRVTAIMLAAAFSMALLVIFLAFTTMTDGQTERNALPEKTKSLIMMPLPRH